MSLATWAVTNILTNLPSIEPLAAASKVQTIYLTGPGPYSANISATTLSTYIDVFARLFGVGLFLNDAGTPVITVTGAELADGGVQNALKQISNAVFQISVSGSVSTGTVANLVNNSFSLLAHITTPIAVADFGSNVAVNLDSLQTLNSSGLLGGIVMLDGGVATLLLSASKVSSDAGALAKISSPYALGSLSNAASFVGNLASLETQAEAGTLTSVSLTDSGIPVLSLTAAQLQADLYALSKITSSHTIALSDSPPITLVLQPWQITSAMLAELGKVTTAFAFSINGPLSAFQAPVLTSSAVLTKLTGAVSFVDFASDFGNNNVANLAAIQTLYAGGHTGTIQFQDGTARLQLTTAQVSANQTALAAVISPYSLSEVVTAAVAAATVIPFVLAAVKTRA